MEAAAVDLSKMKVADLKKELKNRGLSVEGKKNELQERLQEALAADGSVLGAPDDEEEIDEQTEDALLQGKSPAAAKKRASAVPIDVISPDKKVVKLGQAAAPVVSDKPDSEKTAQEKRAERFGLPVADSALKDARAARFGIVASAPKAAGGNKKAPKLDMTTGSTDIEKLKSRAARFGETSSKTLKKVETLEKKKERAERFKNGTEIVPATNGDSSAPVSSSSSTKTQITMGDSKEAEIKKKRAERFAAK